MQSREVRIRPADPAADREEILAVLGRNLPNAARPERHDWLYLSNPQGPARVWIAEDAGSGEAVGTSAGHPKSVRVNGETCRALNLSDFAIDPPYRSLGPALKLLRATLAPMDEGEFDFSYDFPSESMLAIWKRMGGVEIARHRRWVRLLRLRPALERRWGKGVRSGVLGAAGDLVLGLRDGLRGRPRGIDVAPLEGDPPEELGRLDRALAGRFRVRGVRSAADIAWRFVGHTVSPHEVLLARRDGELRGFLVFRPEDGGVVRLVDLLAADDDAAAALAGELAGLARGRGAPALWAEAPEDGAAKGFLEASGFAPREEGPGIVVYAPRRADLAGTLQDPAAWWTLSGDRDV